MTIRPQARYWIKIIAVAAVPVLSVVGVLITFWSDLRVIKSELDYETRYNLERINYYARKVDWAHEYLYENDFVSDLELETYYENLVTRIALLQDEMRIRMEYKCTMQNEKK